MGPPRGVCRVKFCFTKPLAGAIGRPRYGQADASVYPVLAVVGLPPIASYSVV